MVLLFSILISLTENVLKVDILRTMFLKINLEISKNPIIYTCHEAGYKDSVVNERISEKKC